jgi:hypothetical protein
MGKACADHEAEINGVNSTMMVRRGCPQEDVLSPLLWNMVVNSLLRLLNNESLWAQGFADDIAIVSTVYRSNLVSGVGLSVNADKKSMVVFINNRN